MSDDNETRWETQTPKSKSKKRTLIKTKNIRKTIRFSEEEFEIVEQILDEHKLTFTEFSRGAILKKKIKTNLSKDLLFQINKIGNNLNQITRKVNQDLEQEDILIEIKKIKNQLEKIIDVC